MGGAELLITPRPDSGEQLVALSGIHEHAHAGLDQVVELAHGVVRDQYLLQLRRCEELTQ